jgi:replicative DNA helicase
MTNPSMPRHNAEVERRFLGGAIRSRDFLDEAARLVKPEYFYGDAHPKIFQAMLHLADKSPGALDVAVLAEALRRRGEIEDIGGYPYLATLWDNAFFAGVEHYAETIIRDWKIRQAIHAHFECLGRLENAAADPDEELEHAERVLSRIAEADTRGGSVPLSLAKKEALDQLDRRAPGQLRGISTGLPSLDKLTGGLQPGEVIVLGARTSVGKTTLALSIAEHAAIVEARPVLFVSLEMTRTALAERLLCQAAEVKSHDLRAGTISEEERKRLIVAAYGPNDDYLHIDDEKGQTVTRIGAAARRHKRQRGLQLLLIDYLGRIESESTSRRERYEEVGWMMRRLKIIAEDLEIPVMVLGQLNREVENRSDHRPRSSDLRESGDIEQDADVILLLHRPEMYADREQEEKAYAKTGEVEIIISKQRNGPTGSVSVEFDQEFMRMREYAIDTGPNPVFRNGT